MLLKSALSVRGGETTHPLVEVAKDDLRSGDAMVVHEGGEARRLVATFEHGCSEMDVVDVHEPILAEVDVCPLAGALFARPPGQVVLSLMDDGEAAHDHVAKEMTAQVADWRHHPSHSERGANLFGLA